MNNHTHTQYTSVLCGNPMLSLKFHLQMVTGIQHLQTPICSFIAPKMPFQRAQSIQLVIKLTCAETIQEACAHVQAKKSKKEHMCPMHDCVHKKPHTPENDAFMVLFGPSPTSGSAPKSI
jgi:hypothetical protein